MWFTAAYSHYALQTFYLVKPSDLERFHLTIAKVRQRMPAAVPPTSVSSAAPMRSANCTARDSYGDRIAIHIGRSIHIVQLGQVIRIVAQRDYVQLHLTNGRQLRARTPIHVMDTQLAPHGFIRVNRSTLINEAYISSIEPSGRGELNIRASDNSWIVSGACFQDRIVAWLENLCRRGEHLS